MDIQFPSRPAVPARPGRFALLLAVLAAVAGAPLTGAEKAVERTERFDRDPGWEGVNNRTTATSTREVVQDFGFSPQSRRAGGEPGEMGGRITPAAEPAYYARRVDRLTLDRPFSASGRLAGNDRQFHVLVGFFNAGTLNEWRTPNTVAIRLLGRGDRLFAFVEYCTSRWRAGGDNPGGFAVREDPQSGRKELRGFSTGAPHTWSLRYDPSAFNGDGGLTATVDGETAVCRLDPGHKADGAEFNRFGLLNVMKSADDGGEVWLDDVRVLDGPVETFARDPAWEGRGNRRRYVSANVRPRFDFGFSPTRQAGGTAAGEVGGQFFRGDCRYPERMAAYGDRVGPLDLDRPLRISGTVSLHRAVSDSTVLFGFYNARDSMAVTQEQNEALPRAFLGIAVEGPSRDGFFFRPVARGREQGYWASSESGPPHIYPDGRSRRWSLEYTPEGDGGRLVARLDGREGRLTVPADVRRSGVRFDRLGLVTTWIDGNGQQLFFDDLTYTVRQP